MCRKVLQGLEALYLENPILGLFILLMKIYGKYIIFWTNTEKGCFLEFDFVRKDNHLILREILIWNG